MYLSFFVLKSYKIIKYSSDKQSSMQGLEALNFTDNLQWVWFYTKVFVSCVFDFLLYDV